MGPADGRVDAADALGVGEVAGAGAGVTVGAADRQAAANANTTRRWRTDDFIAIPEVERVDPEVILLWRRSPRWNGELD